LARIMKLKKISKNVQKRFQKRVDKLILRIFNAVVKPGSTLARRIFEFKHIQQAVGLLVVTSVFSIAILPNSVVNFQTAVETNFGQKQSASVEIKTERSIRLPLQTFTITQGYRLFHPGLDLAAAKGSPVYPVMEGTVEKIGRDRFAFGNHVVINHGSGLASVYAHLAKIEVKAGEEVTKESIVGLVGSTGWSTGPHLHFQVMQDGHWVNPKAFFETYFGHRLASTK